MENNYFTKRATKEKTFAISINRERLINNDGRKTAMEERKVMYTQVPIA